MLVIVLALAAGATKETAPIFAAAWCWSPWPLLGLLAPALRLLWKRGTDLGPAGHARDALEHPLRTGLAVRRSQLPQHFDWYVLPWGALIVGLASPSPALVASLALAYAQLLTATDLVRLYVWAWPAVAAATFRAVPRSWWLPLMVFHLANPWRGEGF